MKINGMILDTVLTVIVFIFLQLGFISKLQIFCHIILKVAMDVLMFNMSYKLIETIHDSAMLSLYGNFHNICGTGPVNTNNF